MVKLFESLGFKIIYLDLLKDEVWYFKIEKQNIDFLFLSSYVMDTLKKLI